MKTTDDITLVAPCGIYCGDCAAYRAKDDPAVMETLVSAGFKRESCPGCRPLEGNCPFNVDTCENYTCAAGRGIDFCFQCQDFPCVKLNPTAYRADRLPHNMKMFNLCCIKREGVAKWLEQLPEIKQRYYKGKITVFGKGPQLE